MINFQFRNLLEIKDLQEKREPYFKILTQIKANPYIFKKKWQLAEKFTLSQLKKICQRLFKADYEIKNGRLSPEIALDLLLLQI